jgi:hypothetical protein
MSLVTAAISHSATRIIATPLPSGFYETVAQVIPMLAVAVILQAKFSERVASASLRAATIAAFAWGSLSRWRRFRENSLLLASRGEILADVRSGPAS